jgi:hypothetical protein
MVATKKAFVKQVRLFSLDCVEKNGLRDQAPTPEEFDLLPIEERIRLLRSQATWPGSWSKIGPESTSWRRRES